MMINRDSRQKLPSLFFKEWGRHVVLRIFFNYSEREMYFLRMLFYLLFPRIACALVMKWLNNICFFLFITQLSHGNGAASGSRAVKQLADGGDDNKVSPRESEQQQQDTAAQIIQKIWCPAIGDVSTTDVCQHGGRHIVTAFNSVGHIAFWIAQLLDQFQSEGAVCRSSR